MPENNKNEKTECPKCGSTNTYFKEIHPDTSFNDIVLKCRDCGFLDD
jgi:predicted nucleic-acid-binding Zn-ribbon protein